MRPSSLHANTNHMGPSTPFAMNRNHRGGFAVAENPSLKSTASNAMIPPPNQLQPNNSTTSILDSNSSSIPPRSASAIPFGHHQQQNSVASNHGLFKSSSFVAAPPSTTHFDHFSHNTSGGGQVLNKLTLALRNVRTLRAALDEAEGRLVAVEAERDRALAEQDRLAQLVTDLKTQIRHQDTESARLHRTIGSLQMERERRQCTTEGVNADQQLYSQQKMKKLEAELEHLKTEIAQNQSAIARYVQETQRRVAEKDAVLSKLNVDQCSSDRSQRQRIADLEAMVLELQREREDTRSILGNARSLLAQSFGSIGDDPLLSTDHPIHSAPRSATTKSVRWEDGNVFNSPSKRIDPLKTEKYSPRPIPQQFSPRQHLYEQRSSPLDTPKAVNAQTQHALRERLSAIKENNHRLLSSLHRR